MLTVLRSEPALTPTSQCFFATARSCIVHLIRKYGPSVAYLPTLVPEGLLAPFDREKIKIRRYPLKAGLEPDCNELERMLAGAIRPLVVVVHYFGYAMPTFEATVLAHSRGGIVLEDAAHAVLNPSIERGCADVAVYSLNKFLPVTDGAYMLSRNPDVDLTEPTNLEENAEATNAYRRHLLANRLLATSQATDLQDRWLLKIKKQSKDAYEEYYKIISRDMEPRQPSHATMAVFQSIDFGKYRTARLAVAERVLNELNESEIYRAGLPMFAFPVRTRSRSRAIEAFAEAGIDVAYIHEKWGACGKSDSPEADFMKSHILLPLNERVKDEIPSLMAKTLRSI
jgi:hypothetical protein